MAIDDSTPDEEFVERFASEMRVTPRPGDRADIRELMDLMLVETPEEVVC